MTGWANSTRRARLPPDWHKRRARAKRNAAGQCQAITDGQRCTEPGTDCDHIDRHGGDDQTNLQWLCRHHHNAKTARESAAARALSPKSQRPPQKHPGLL